MKEGVELYLTVHIPFYSGNWLRILRTNKYNYPHFIHFNT
jgi:hypothetical protein